VTLTVIFMQIFFVPADDPGEVDAITSPFRWPWAGVGLLHCNYADGRLGQWKKRCDSPVCRLLGCRDSTFRCHGRDTVRASVFEAAFLLITMVCLVCCCLAAVATIVWPFIIVGPSIRCGVLAG